VDPNFFDSPSNHGGDGFYGSLNTTLSCPWRAPSFAWGTVFDKGGFQSPARTFAADAKRFWLTGRAGPGLGDDPSQRSAALGGLRADDAHCA